MAYVNLHVHYVHAQSRRTKFTVVVQCIKKSKTVQNIRKSAYDRKFATVNKPPNYLFLRFFSPFTFHTLLNPDSPREREKLPEPGSTTKRNLFQTCSSIIISIINYYVTFQQLITVTCTLYCILWYINSTNLF